MGSRHSHEIPYEYNWDKINEEASGDLARPIFKNGRYGNPFDTFVDRHLGHVIKWKWTSRDLSDVPWKNKQLLDETLPIVHPDLSKLADPPEDKVQLMWVGHASVLVQFDGITVLTDPVFGKRCGPMGIMGPPRYREPPCEIEDIPNLDAVVISHNHYDHLEHSAVTRLDRKFGDKLRWFVASGQAQWMRNQGCSNVTELSWWEEHVLEKDGKFFTFAATPAQHWCMRTGPDRFKALWCSWVIKGPRKSFYFAGDTGYCFAFKQIGRKYGPFSLAAIPIGAYEPRWFMRPQHVDPQEAVYIHNDVRAERSVGIHWGTFSLTDEFYLEPKQKLADVMKVQNMKDEEFFTLCHGEIVTVDGNDKNTRPKQEDTHL